MRSFGYPKMNAGSSSTCETPLRRVAAPPTELTVPRRQAQAGEDPRKSRAVRVDTALAVGRIPWPIRGASVAGETYLISRRCYQRTFRLRPCAQTNRIFLYCPAFAAERTGVVVHATCVMPNPHHMVVTDRHGVLPNFLRELHRLTANAMNASQGQWENLWAAEHCNAVRLLRGADSSFARSATAFSVFLPPHAIPLRARHSSAPPFRLRSDRLRRAGASSTPGSSTAPSRAKSARRPGPLCAHEAS